MSIKILHIASGDRWAGAEAQLFTLLTGLDQQGCDVVAVLFNEGELASRLRNAGISVRIAPEEKLSLWQLIAVIRNILSEERPDVIHSHRQKENIVGAVANFISTRAASCRTVHGANEFKPNLKQNLQRYIDDCIGRWLQDRIVAVSDEMHISLGEKFGFERVKKIYNGVDIDGLMARLKPAEFKVADPNAVHIGIVGRLEAVKRIDLFLRIAQLLIERGMEVLWHFHIVGDGSQGDEMKALAKQLGVSDYVTFHGHQNDIASIISSLEAVVMCSDHEGMPMVALETIALNTKLVAHDVGGLRSLRGFDGVYLVSDNNLKEYFAILSGPVLDEKNKNNNDSFDQAFSKEAMTRKTLAMYKEMVG